MPRLANRGTTNRAPSSAAAFPPFPSMDPHLAEIDGGKTNAAFQRWNAQMRARLEGNSQQDNGRFRDVQITNDRQDGYLESVWTMQAIAGPVVTGMTLFSSVDPKNNTTVSRITFQADVFQIQTATGNHKEVFSTSADAIKLGDVLTIDLANATIYIGDGVFASATTPFYVDDLGRLSLKDKLTFDGTTLTVGNAYIDSNGAVVLGLANDVLILTAADSTYRIWAGNATAGSAAFSVTKGGALFSTAGTIAGWAIGTTTISQNNAILDSAGQLILGTASDVLIVSASDPTYRIWAGSVTAAIASFSVTKGGALFSNSGMLGGFTIGSTSLSSTSGGDTITLSATAGGFLEFEGSGLSTTFFAIEGMTVINSSGNFAAVLRSDSGVGTYGILELYDGLSGTPSISCDGSTGVITATGFSGSGASLTSLNANNLSSGTVPTARLGSGSAGSGTFLRGDQTWAAIVAGNVSGLAASATTDTTNATNISSGTLSSSRLSFSSSPTGDVPINGFVSVGGVKLATVA